MQIYNKEAINVLCDIFKDISKEIPIFKETQNNDENSIPKSYLLLMSDKLDDPKVFGDGVCFIKNSDCDVHLVSKGAAQNSNCLHNINKRKIKDLLNKKEITYSSYDLGYNKDSDTTDYVFSITVTHYVKKN